MLGLRSGAVFGSRRLIGLDSVFVSIGFVMFIMRVCCVSFRSPIRCSGRRLDGSRIGKGHRRQRLARLNIAMVVIRVIVFIVSKFTIVRVLVMLMMVALMMFRIGVMMFGVVGVIAFAVRVFRVFFRAFLAFLALMRLSDLRRLGARVLDDLALDALAIAAAARVAVARTAAIGAVFALLLGLAMGAFIRFDQGLAIGDGDLIIVGGNFAESQKAVADGPGRREDAA